MASDLSPREVTGRARGQTRSAAASSCGKPTSTRRPEQDPSVPSFALAVGLTRATFGTQKVTDVAPII
jgi:hypothetical protein